MKTITIVTLLTLSLSMKLVAKPDSILISDFFYQNVQIDREHTSECLSQLKSGGKDETLYMVNFFAKLKDKYKEKKDYRAEITYEEIKNLISDLPHFILKDSKILCNDIISGNLKPSLEQQAIQKAAGFIVRPIDDNLIIGNETFISSIVSTHFNELNREAAWAGRVYSRLNGGNKE